MDVKHHVYLLHRVRPSNTRLDRLPSLMSSMSAQSQASARETPGRGLRLGRHGTWHGCSARPDGESVSSPTSRQLHSQQFQREFRDRWYHAGMTWDTLVPLGQWFQSQQRSGGSQPDCDWGYPGTYLSLAAPRGTHLNLAAPRCTHLSLAAPGGTRVPISAWLRLGVPGYPSQLGCAWGYPGTHLSLVAPGGTRVPISTPPHELQLYPDASTHCCRGGGGGGGGGEGTSKICRSQDCGTSSGGAGTSTFWRWRQRYDPRRICGTRLVYTHKTQFESKFCLFV